MSHTIFVGMSKFTAALHWQVFGFSSRLPELDNASRLRCIEVAHDYDWIMRGGGTPYTLSAPRDRLTIIDMGNLTGMRPNDLKEFYATRDNPAELRKYNPWDR